VLTGQDRRESQRARASLAESRRLELLGNPSKTGPVGSGAPAGQFRLLTILYLIFLLFFPSLEQRQFREREREREMLFGIKHIKHICVQYSILLFSAIQEMMPFAYSGNQ